MAFDIGQLQTLTTCVTHVLPVSDDGGSTAEIVRVLGGPAVGDIRSRCLRLADDSNEEVNVPPLIVQSLLTCEHLHMTMLLTRPPALVRNVERLIGWMEGGEVGLKRGREGSGAL